MKKGRITFLLILAISFLPILAAHAVDVTAVGFGSDRTTAIVDAKRNAIARVVGEYVDSRTLVENFALVSDRILSSSSGYVKSYDLLNTETFPTGEVKVEIRADVTRDMLTEDIDRIQVLSAKRGDPRFVVIPDPQLKQSGIEPAVIEATGNGIKNYLSENGYSTVHAPYHNITRNLDDPAVLQDLSQWAAGVGAEFVIYFDVVQVEEPAGRVFQRASALASVTVVHTGSYRIIATTDARGSSGDQHSEFAFRDACKIAGSNVAHKAMGQVLADWNRRGSVQGNRLMLEIENMPADANVAFEQKLSGTGAVKQVQLSSKSDDLTVYQVTVDGSTHDLGSAMMQVASDLNWQVWLTEASRTRMKYALVFD
ncbi:hypothetical protein KQI52_15170 [bacterium]|nr:hypothetical protein [bacterium]